MGLGLILLIIHFSFEVYIFVEIAIEDGRLVIWALFDLIVFFRDLAFYQRGPLLEKLYRFWVDLRKPRRVEW